MNIFCSRPRNPTATTYIYDSAQDIWYQGLDYLTPIYGGTRLTNPNLSSSFEIFGGSIDYEGNESNTIGAYFADTDAYLEKVDGADARSQALSVYVPNVCPGASELL